MRLVDPPPSCCEQEPGEAQQERQGIRPNEVDRSEPLGVIGPQMPGWRLAQTPRMRTPRTRYQRPTLGSLALDRRCTSIPTATTVSPMSAPKCQIHLLGARAKSARPRRIEADGSRSASDRFLRESSKRSDRREESRRRSVAGATTHRSPKASRTDRAPEGGRLRAPRCLVAVPGSSCDWHSRRRGTRRATSTRARSGRSRPVGAWSASRRDTRRERAGEDHCQWCAGDGSRRMNRNAQSDKENREHQEPERRAFEPAEAAHQDCDGE